MSLSACADLDKIATKHLRPI